MKVFLHIGSHKTATTAIQFFARKNREWLLDRGLLYPSLEMVDERPQQSHLGVMSGLFRLGGRRAVDPEIGRRFLFKSAEVSRARNVNILLSAENLFRLPQQVREEAFELFRSVFHGFDIVVVAGLRRQDNLADSLYKSITKVNRRQPNFSDFLESRRGVFAYEEVVSHVEACHVQRPLLLPFTQQGRKQFLPDFFRSIQVDISEAPAAAGRKNVSYDLVDCLVKFSLFDLRVHENVLERFDGFVERHPLRTQYSFFTKASRKEFMSEYVSQNEVLVERFPELKAALSADTPMDVSQPVDDECHDMAAQRLAEFRDFLVRGAQ